MVDVIFSALYGLVTTPHTLGLMFLGVFFGLLVGVVPGIGGRLSIALAIPFIFGMDMVSGAVFLLTMHATNGTSGQISSIMFGVPGDGDDAATILDGYPMAKKGEAGRALGASVTASGVGGLFGAFVFAIMIPVLEPVVMAFSPAEFFLLALLGITFIAFLAGGGQIFRGIIVGLFGMLLSTIGTDPYTGTPRFAGDMLFLWDGLSLVTAVLAMFAIPEMISLAVRGGSISAVSKEQAKFSYRQLFEGVLQVPKHWWLALRCSAIGALVGMVPGLGSNTAAWLAYGHAVQSSKTPERFGHGAIEGVMAPEFSSNAREGGSLLPTLFFGIPGSSGMAVLMGAFIILGIQPGPAMLTTNLHLTWTLIWALVIGNLIAVCFLMFIMRWAATLTFVNGAMLVPFIVVVAVVGSYVNEGQWENLIVLLMLSIVGYGLLRFNWPRAPFVIGLVLGRISEESLHKALGLWGLSFFTRPLSMILVGMIAATIAFAIYRNMQSSKSAKAFEPVGVAQ
ncbi:MAG TPA: tripartite tricarboxylate transporter permease [Xanthobacteraceae bacterium]|nr:tripartite tricarboxylate transporter permease [Xanthobacteraceae bacterium]